MLPKESNFQCVKNDILFQLNGTKTLNLATAAANLLPVFDVDSKRWFRALAPPAGGDGNYNHLKRKVVLFNSCKILVNSGNSFFFFKV